MPVLAGALYSLVASGAVDAAGSVYGKATVVLPPTVQVTFVSHAGAAGAEPTVVAPAGKVLPLVVLNRVEVAVMFQPAPEPVASAMSSGCWKLMALSWPFSAVAGKVTVPGVVANPSEPAVSVSDAVVAPAGAATSNRLVIAAAPMGSIVRSFIQIPSSPGLQGLCRP